ncbi:hypothetical protein [Paenibacillus dakarensis]|uniref:hypothetical protein n=1 Tax=Paenibacillus dakarensis TaxID=1527293 RepID=UPI0006D56D79|nr:hypothetical protein [Paenibacillus dakarensis]
MSLKIHEHQQPRMQPFYWILTFEMMTIAMLLGIALVAGPIVLLSLWPSGWMGLTLLALPFGLIIFIKSYRSLKERVWHNRHTNSYAMYEDRIEYIIWDRKTKEADQGSIEIRDIQEIYYGRHLQQYSYAYKKTTMTEKAPMFELFPVLHLIHKKGLQQKVLTIPFIEFMGANRWLEALASYNIPLWLSSIVVSDSADESLGDLLKGDEDKAPAVFDGNIEREFRPYSEELISRESERELTDEELAELEDQMKQLENAELEKKKKSALGNIGLLAWLVLPLQYGLSRWMMYEADRGTINPEGMLYPVLMVVLTSILFFLLVKRMRWLQMIIYQLASVVVAVAVNIDSPEDETHPLYQITAGITVSIVFYSALIWITYFSIKYLRRGRDARKDTASHTAAESRPGQGEPRIYR